MTDHSSQRSVAFLGVCSPQAWPRSNRSTVMMLLQLLPVCCEQLHTIWSGQPVFNLKEEGRCSRWSVQPLHVAARGTSGWWHWCATWGHIPPLNALVTETLTIFFNNDPNSEQHPAKGRHFYIPLILVRKLRPNPTWALLCQKSHSVSARTFVAAQKLGCLGMFLGHCRK